MSTLVGKTALVTGSSRGIGRAVAERLGREGARVAVHYRRDEAAAKDTVSAVEAAGGSAFAIQAELGVPNDAQTLWDAFDGHADTLDILVNNVGLEPGEFGIAATTPDGFDDVFATNVKAPFFVTQHALGRMRDGGRIVNISSTLTSHASAQPEYVTYAMAKSGLEILTSALAKQLGQRGITVNTVAPGLVETEPTKAKLFNEEARQFAASLVALGRLGQPEDVASAVAFLVSPDGGWVTGQYLDTSGGMLL
ncbi:3-oxoacyl-[acyl-carrier protein] reductase [Haloactinopolyspora alba]|uniref:3-oxoacyl-[acyl-carrier protein] reductase n=1 Tax=Haloactinopolyspora alba TaxID=648780 RepID=A0A2P8E948_9ACTN|nr:SDR family oxidoreductase [Haloactinopolyspora alba]PSL05985.1 3-oxoacyl-[acyl-carrier protein] reductase [Haloactinopolyspora alba]